MTIWANCIVNNEENFVWFAIMSVVDFVDKVLVYDTGSTDKTVEIIRKIREIKGDKVEFRQVGKVNDLEFTKMRQKMLEQSRCDWILVLDGDEIWWEDSIKKVTDKIREDGNRIEGIVVPMVVPVGDIYHLQDEKAGQYNLLGHKGHYSLRAINRRILGLHVDLPYGTESYFDGKNVLIQERKSQVFLDAPYLHVTHLRRSSLKRKKDKLKHELGSRVSEDYKFPEVLYKDYPRIIPSPWSKISGIPLLQAKLLTPLRKIKRRFL